MWLQNLEVAVRVGSRVGVGGRWRTGRMGRKMKWFDGRERKNGG